LAFVVAEEEAVVKAAPAEQEGRAVAAAGPRLESL
jgi:hypothetical protein